MPEPESGPSEAGEGVYDRCAALARLMDNPKLLQDLAGFFHEDSPLLLEKVTKALTAEDSAQVARAIHSLAGLASNFEARATVEAARRVEALAKAGDLAQAREAFETLRREVLRLDQALTVEREMTTLD